MFFASCGGFHGEACAVFAGPYTVTHHKSTLLISDLPFSYRIEHEDESILVPGVNLRSVGTIRDVRKWPRRDRRKAVVALDQMLYADARKEFAPTARSDTAWTVIKGPDGRISSRSEERSTRTASSRKLAAMQPAKRRLAMSLSAGRRSSAASATEETVATRSWKRFAKHLSAG